MIANLKKKINIFQVAGIFSLVLILILVVADFKMFYRKKELALQVKNYKKQIAEIQASNENLKNEIANSDNKDYLEKVAYEQLGQQRQGEEQVIFVRQENKAEEPVKKNNFWQNFLDWIKSKF